MGTSKSSDQQRALLLQRLKSARLAAGLTQAQLADLAGVSRMSVARAEAPGADLQLSTLEQMAGRLGLGVSLQPLAAQEPPVATKVVHRGAAYNRVQGAAASRNPREVAFAKAWEEVNQPSDHLTPMLDALLGSPTPSQAMVAATVVQWLGSEVGFDFLSRVLEKAGLEIKERPAQPR